MSIERYMLSDTGTTIQEGKQYILDAYGEADQRNRDFISSLVK